MINKISPIPEIPKELRSAANRGQLIPFIGAGVSRLGGCPGWDDLANKALKFFINKGKLNHAQLYQLYSLHPRIKLSLALEFEKSYNLRIDFNELLEPSAEREDIREKIYENLTKLATTFVTTNYDDFIYEKLQIKSHINNPMTSSEPLNTSHNCFHELRDINYKNIDMTNSVFHIHGSIKFRESMVLSTIDYLNRYSSHRIDGKGNHENLFLTFLQNLFRLKNVLFVGYGLDELEILEFIVQKGINKQLSSSEAPRHFVLEGFFTHELELARKLESYFLQFGIKLLPFSRDEKDREQLVEIIEYLAKEIPSVPQLALAKRQEMEELIS